MLRLISQEWKRVDEQHEKANVLLIKAAHVHWEGEKLRPTEKESERQAGSMRVT